MKFQKSVDLGGIYFAKVELTLKFDLFFEYFSGNVGILFSLGIEKEPMKFEFPHNFIGSAIRLLLIFCFV